MATIAHKPKAQSQHERDALRIANVDIDKVGAKIRNNLNLDSWETCSFLGLSIRVFRELLHQGKLPYQKIGSRVFVSGADADAFRNSQRKEIA